MQEPQHFAAERSEKGNPRDVTARAIEAGDEALPDRIAAKREYDRNRGGRRLGSQNRAASSRCGDHRHITVDQVVSKRRQSIGLVLRKTVFDRHVATFDVADFA